MSQNTRDLKYGHFDGNEQYSDETTDQFYNKNTRMSQHGISNMPSSNEGNVHHQKMLMPSTPVAFQDAEYQKPFNVQEHYDSTSVESVQGKIFILCTCVTFIFQTIACKIYSIFCLKQKHSCILNLQ